MKGKTKAFSSKRRELLLVGILILGVILSFTNVATAAGKPDVVRSYSCLDLTGPYAPVTGPLGPAMEDAWKYINNELGGVHGVKIEGIIRDNAGKPPLGLSMYNEAINMKPKPVFFFAGTSPIAEALRERFREDDIIGHSPTSLSSIYPAGYAIGLYPLYTEQFATSVKLVRDKWKEKRNLRLGIVVWDSAFGRSVLENEFFDYVKSIGVDIVGTELMSMKDVDVTSQLLRLKAKNPDWLLINVGGGSTISVKKGCKDLGWDIKTINVMGSCWSTVRLAPQLFDGDIATFNTRSFDDTNSPSIKKILQYFKENKRTETEIAAFYLIGWVSALVEHASMVSCVDKYGWEGLNAKNVFESLCNLSFKPLGDLSDVTFSRKRPTPTKTMSFEIRNGKLLPLSADFLEVPDMRPAKYK